MSAPVTVTLSMIIGLPVTLISLCNLAGALSANKIIKEIKSKTEIKSVTEGDIDEKVNKNNRSSTKMH